MSDIEDELRRELETLRQQLADVTHARETTALAAETRAIHDSRALLWAVFERSPDALLLADDRGVYVDVNAAACGLFGLPREHLVGRNLQELASEHEAVVRAPLVVGTVRVPAQVRLRRPDGTSRVLEVIGVANVSPGLHLSALRDITDRVDAEDALRRSEVRFRAMIEKGHDGISLLSADVRTLYQSPAVERLLGYSLGDAAQMHWQDFVDEDEIPKLASTLTTIMKGPGATAALEFRIRRQDGAPCWLELTATNQLDDPDIGAIITNFRDITQRKALEEERNGFFQLSLDLLCVAGTDGRFQRLNPAWETTLGWSVEELCSHPWLHFVHPDDLEATVHEGARLAQGRIVVRFENRYRCQDGSYRWLQWACIPTASGLIYGCAHDVTSERVTAERDRLLFMASPLPMLLVDADTRRLLDANDACVEAYGYSRDELLLLRLDDIAVEEALSPSPGAGTTASDRQHRTKRGERRWVRVTSHRLNLGGRAAILEVIVDVTETKRLEEERSRYIERLRLLELSVSRLNDIVLITKATPLAGQGPEIVFVNAAFERITGYTSEETLGRTPRMLQGPDSDPVALARVRAALERAEPVREEIINYTKAGIPYWLELDISPVRDDAGELTHFVAVERDTTEQHRVRAALQHSEEQLRQAQKMEAIGSLAGGIAHDFNNLLSVILSYTSMIMEDLPVVDPMRADLEEVHRAGLRATEMTRQLLAFSRKQMLQPRVVDVSAVVRALEKMLGRMIGEDITLRLHTSAEAERAFIDPGQLEQVIMNLVVNARDAMPDGGQLTVETSSVVVDEAYAASHAGIAPGAYVLLVVTDTGCGMDRATQDRVFEPFFTTKEQGRGTGLGLSMVYGIVRQSGGHIWLASELGHGTTFQVYLPRTDRIAEPAVEAQPSVGMRGSETILLVEDEDPVRHVVRSILTKGGYHVLEAQNAGEAVLVCEQYKAKIHLLLTDVVMPRMSGYDLAERLAALRPDMRSLFVSGYTESAALRDEVIDAGVEFLAKPILPDPLLRKVRQILDGRSRRSSSTPAD